MCFRYTWCPLPCSGTTAWHRSVSLVVMAGRRRAWTRGRSSTSTSRPRFFLARRTSWSPTLQHQCQSPKRTSTPTRRSSLVSSTPCASPPVSLPGTTTCRKVQYLITYLNNEPGAKKTYCCVDMFVISTITYLQLRKSSRVRKRRRRKSQQSRETTRRRTRVSACLLIQRRTR